MCEYFKERACQHGLSSFIGRRRKIIQFWLVLFDQMFFHNLSKILTIPFSPGRKGDKKSGVLLLPQIEMCWLMPNILNPLWAISLFVDSYSTSNNRVSCYSCLMKILCLEIFVSLIYSNGLSKVRIESTTLQ